MRITILGGAGFLGSHLAEAFLSDHHHVTVFDRPDADRTNFDKIRDKIYFVSGDFLKIDEVIPSLQSADIVVHMISATSPGNSFDSPLRDVELNVLPSILLIEECIRLKVKKIVFLSSGGTVYGIPQKLPIKESHPLNPITPYGVSKVVIEKYLAMYAHHHPLDYSILRLSNPYGPRQNPRSGQGVVAAWLELIRQGKPVEIWGDGEVVRDYIYIDDAINAIKLATLSHHENKIFNIGSGIGYSLNQLHRLLEENLGLSIFVNFKSARPADVPVNILDSGLLENSLGWHAVTPMNEGIKKTWVGYSHD